MAKKSTAQNIRNRIAKEQQEFLALREQGAQKEREVTVIKNELLRRQGKITELQDLLKDIEN